MHTFLKYFQLIVSLLLIFTVLLQNKTSGFSVGGSQNVSFQPTKRGAEKVIFNATIIFAALFVASSIAFLFVS